MERSFKKRFICMATAALMVLTLLVPVNVFAAANEFNALFLPRTGQTGKTFYLFIRALS